MVAPLTAVKLFWHWFGNSSELALFWFFRIILSNWNETIWKSSLQKWNVNIMVAPLTLILNFKLTFEIRDHLLPHKKVLNENFYWGGPSWPFFNEILCFWTFSMQIWTAWWVLENRTKRVVVILNFKLTLKFVLVIFTIITNSLPSDDLHCCSESIYMVATLTLTLNETEEQQQIRLDQQKKRSQKIEPERDSKTRNAQVLALNRKTYKRELPFVHFGPKRFLKISRKLVCKSFYNKCLCRSWLKSLVPFVIFVFQRKNRKKYRSHKFQILVY